jgi:hypothetical protein
MARRPFDFTDTVINEAWKRQWSRCALCGDVLIEERNEDAHHVVPNHLGDPNDPKDAVLRSTDNCVILCAGCHEEAHAGGDDYAGVVLDPREFDYSHGKESGKHNLWAQNMVAIWTRLGRRQANRK